MVPPLGLLGLSNDLFIVKELRMRRLRHRHFVWVSKVCGQNGYKVSNKDKSSYNCLMQLKWLLLKYENYGTLSINLL